MYARHLKTGEIAITVFSGGGNLSVTQTEGLSGIDASRTRMSGKSMSDYTGSGRRFPVLF
jgi:hypothetical protein